MIKILHAADFHLDSAFSSLPPQKAALRREEQRLLLEELSLGAEGCDLVLLAGDLFDSARIYRDSLEALKSFCARVSCPVCIAPGNHDCLLPGSPYLTENWGENVHIFTSDRIDCLSFPELGCKVYGAAFLGPRQGPLLRDFRAAPGDSLNLMVLHGDLQADSPYCPITPEEIASSGLAYLALGHVHSPKTCRAGSTVYAYPGCLMGRGFDECGPRGYLTAEVSHTGCTTEFHPLSGRKYEIFRVPAGEDPLAAIRSTLPPSSGRDCCRILLTGEAPPVRVRELEEALSPEFFSLSIRDCTTPVRDLWEAAGEDTLRGRFLSDLKARYDAAPEEGQERRVILQAARYVLDLMDSREVVV